MGKPSDGGRPKELLFSVTKKDLKIETFRAGGNGGQNQNKRDTGVRIRHLASGAVAESRTFRTQGENKKSAFLKMIKTKEFQVWQRKEIARATQNVDESLREVAQALRDENVKTEVRAGGKWATV